MLVSPRLDEDAAKDVAAALDGLGEVEVSALLLRGGGLDDDSFARLAAPLIAAAQARDIAVLLEDRPALLPDSGADGLHLTLSEKKSPVKDLRRRFGDDVILGAGCGSSRHLAMTAGEQGADYIGFGDLDRDGDRDRKDDEEEGALADPEIIAWWEAVMTPPQVAFGAGTPEEARTLAAAGPDFLALGPALWLAGEDPAKALHDLLAALAEKA